MKVVFLKFREHYLADYEGQQPWTSVDDIVNFKTELIPVVGLLVGENDQYVFVSCSIHAEIDTPNTLQATPAVVIEKRSIVERHEIDFDLFVSYIRQAV